jgi:hypothetical protein
MLAKIVGGLDKLLDTRYSEELRRIKNLDDKLLFVVRVLSLHRLGMLVVDENQSGNFEESVWQAEFILFFLALMNLGVAVVLMGNPLAFGSLRRVSQVMRRFSSIGYYEMLPAQSALEPWWDLDYVPGMTCFTLCERIPPLKQIKSFAFDNSGGIRGIWASLWVAAQKIALRRGGQTAVLTPKDLEAARDTPKTRELVAIAAATLGRLNDRTYDDLPQLVGNSKSPGSNEGGAQSAYGPPKPAPPPSSAQLKRLVNSLNNHQRKANQAAEYNKKRLKTFSEDDLRRNNDALSILAGLRNEQGELFEKGKRAKKR